MDLGRLAGRDDDFFRGEASCDERDHAREFVVAHASEMLGAAGFPQAGKADVDRHAQRLQVLYVGTECEQLVAEVFVQAEQDAGIGGTHPGLHGTVEVRQPAFEVAARVPGSRAHEFRVDVWMVGLLKRAHGDMGQERAIFLPRDSCQELVVLVFFKRTDVDQDVAETALDCVSRRFGGAGQHGFAIGAAAVFPGQHGDRLHSASLQSVELISNRTCISGLTPEQLVFAPHPAHLALAITLIGEIEW